MMLAHVRLHINEATAAILQSCDTPGSRGPALLHQLVMSGIFLFCTLQA
jgi:hypothetical protein